ncbi:MAG TPA: hypothetical protein VLC46_20010 [Thermoanaerobaculia bacterium]|jgi:hypothetical protein|nr:hypothetical protein [Thermoanaerobaculia bacterium]
MADDKPRNADFIERIVSDAKNPPETRMLTGWFGNSGEEGYRRLYTDAELNHYVDIPDDAILYSEPLRDAQPAGCFVVWVKSDAVLKPGGSAASRAARFLQGQVQQDFASAGAAGSLEKAGLRCVTEVPCGEPTGFTGQCTKQPEVGGAWPCVTAVPHCYEVTGFTGKCTQAPWPNPTRYIGCTILHCPTHDLTHIPHICNIVASGQPGCVVVNPPQGGDPAQKVADAEVDERSAPATSIPGCGYTKTWGVCDTHLLGCGVAAANAQAAYITSICAPTAFCHVSQNCGNAPAAETWTAAGCTRMRPVCYPTEICHYTQPPQCRAEQFQGYPQLPTKYPECQQARAGETISQGMEPCTKPIEAAFAAQPASAICATAIGCDITLLCPTPFVQICHPTPICPTRFQPQCFPVASPFCPVTPGCPFGPGGPGTPVQGGGFAAFGAAAPDARFVVNTDAPCSAVDSCPSRICDTQPPTALCTPNPQFCPTFCGPDCQTNQPHPVCTSVNCLTNPAPQCSPSNVWHDCTSIGSTCPTKGQPGCLTMVPNVCPAPTLQVCNARVGAQVFAAAQPQAVAGVHPTIWTQLGPQCPSHLLGCTHFGPQCRTYPRGDCTFFGCPSPGIDCTVVVCTHFGPQCPPHPSLQGQLCPITTGGPQCPEATGFNCPSQLGCQSIACGQTAACVSAGCQPGGGQQQFAQRAVGAPQTLAPFCTQVGVNCPNTHAIVCTQLCTQAGPQCPNQTLSGPLCPISGGPQCPPPSGLLCASQLGCPSAVCGVQSVACASGACAGGQQEFAAVGAARAAAGGGGGIGVTAWEDCTHFGWQCPPFFTQFEQECVVQSVFTLSGPQCVPPTVACPPPPPTPFCPSQHLVICTAFGPQCPHQTVAGQLCPITVSGPQCPVASGINCPSAFGCQSVACGQTAACVSAGCQPGGGQQAFAARTGVNCTALYCQYVTQVSCTRFPCNPYTAWVWACNYPN